MKEITQLDKAQYKGLQIDLIKNNSENLAKELKIGVIKRILIETRDQEIIFIPIEKDIALIMPSAVSFKSLMPILQGTTEKNNIVKNHYNPYLMIYKTLLKV